MRPRRQGKSADVKFEDPLKNYDGPEYADDLERAIADESVAVMKTTPVFTVTVDTTVQEAMQSMARYSIASILVIDGDSKLLGIFSERDVLNKVADRFDQIKDESVSQVMTAAPMHVYVTDSPGKAMNLMATAGFRHVPILDADDKVVGVVGPRRVTHFLDSYLVSE
jgi:CBS domain-containing protein